MCVDGDRSPRPVQHLQLRPHHGARDADRRRARSGRLTVCATWSPRSARSTSSTTAQRRGCSSTRSTGTSMRCRRHTRHRSTGIVDISPMRHRSPTWHSRSRAHHPRCTGCCARCSTRRAEGAERLHDWSRRSQADVMAEYFDDWHLVMPAVSTGPDGVGRARTRRRAPVWPPPIYATRHLVKTGRPAGGSGALTDAVRASFEAGGRASSMRQPGRAAPGARWGGRRGATRRRHRDAGDHRRRCVRPAAGVRRVGGRSCRRPPRRLVDRWRAAPVHDGYESKIDAVLSEPAAVSDRRRRRRRSRRVPTSWRRPPSYRRVPTGSPRRTTSARPRRVAAEPDLPGQRADGARRRDAAGPRPARAESRGAVHAVRPPRGLAGIREPSRWLDLLDGFMEPGRCSSIDGGR